MPGLKPVDQENNPGLAKLPENVRNKMGYMKEGGMAKKTKAEKKVGKVMGEFKEGKLKSSSGQKVTNRKQAVAIALSEAGMSKKMQEGGMAKKEKWIQEAIKKPGALRKTLKVKEGEKISEKELAKAAKAPGKTGQRARLAQTLKKMK
jgi:hypothetical protein